MLSRTAAALWLALVVSSPALASSPLTSPPRPPASSQGSSALLPADGANFAREVGPRARLVHDRDGRLRLATHLDLALPKGDPAAQIDRLLERFPHTLPTPEGLTARTRVLELGPVTWVQRTWTRDGIPVRGLSLTLHLDQRGHVRLISAPGLGNTGGPAPTWSPEREIETKARALAAHLLGAPPADLRLYRGLEATSDGLRALWRVPLDPEPPLLPLEMRLSGLTGAPIGIFPRASSHAPLDTRDARGTVYQDSPLDGDTIDGDLPDLTDPERLTGLWTEVYNYVPTAGGQQVQTAEPTSSNGARYDYPPIEQYSGGLPTSQTQSDIFAEVMMYHHVNRVHDYFNELGYLNDDPWTGIDRTMSATVNYRSRSGYYDNAYYSHGSEGDYAGEIVFGQGQASDFTYDASVIYHEYGHAVVNGTSNYGQGCQDDLYGSDCTEGGLNEGTADYFAASFRNDPGVGQYAIGQWLPAYARDLTDGNRCPDDLYGEVHEDGKIWGGAMWDIRTRIAGDDADYAHRRIDPIIFAAIATPLPGNATGESALGYAADVMDSVAEAAVADGALTASELVHVKTALDDRGLVACQRFVPLSLGRGKSGAFSATVFPLPGAVTRAGLQYVVEVQESALALEFRIDGLTDATLYLRRDRPVEYLSSSEVEADYVVQGLSLELDNDTPVRLEPGTYYITFTSKVTLASALYGYYYNVYANVQKSFESGEPSGCGCGHGARPGAGPGLTGLVVAGALIRRRRSNGS